MAIESVRLSEDRQTVFLEVPNIQPVMGMSIRYTLQAADGTPIGHEIYNTINRVPSE